MIWRLPENSNLFLNPKGECLLLLHSGEREYVCPTFPGGNMGTLLREHGCRGWGVGRLGDQRGWPHHPLPKLQEVKRRTQRWLQGHAYVVNQTRQL